MGGIILNPSVISRVPDFRAAIFLTESLPNLTLIINLGLVLYFFLIGLETDIRFLINNWRVATAVAFTRMTLPFALSYALARGLYNQIANDKSVIKIEFSVYILFIGVAIAIAVL